MQLTAHFSFEELTISEYAQRHGIPNNPPPGIVDNLKITANGMEKVRDVLGGSPIHVNSGYRSPMVNSQIGGAKNSAHCTGFACDFIAPYFGSTYIVAVAISQSAIQFDQLILEYGWVHISFAPTMRMQMLTKKSANSPYLNGLQP